MTVTVLDRCPGDRRCWTGDRRAAGAVRIRRCPSRAAPAYVHRRVQGPEVQEYDAAPNGEKGALLRREGLYSSHIIEWRRAIAAGDLASSTAKRPDKTRAKAAADATELARLRRENARLRTELDKTREALVVTGKVHALLSTLSESAD